MWVIFIEAGVALALLLIIVWATWPKRDPARIDTARTEETPHDGQP